jgi:YggT family protein
MGVVIVAALLSWINPHAPLAPLFNQLAQPMLRPVQRLIPTIGGVDLSPLAVLLLLQVAQAGLGFGRAALLPFVVP